MSRQQEQKSPTAKSIDLTSKARATPPAQNSLDNPNYQQLPPPPTPPPESPATSKSSESQISQKVCVTSADSGPSVLEVVTFCNFFCMI